MKKGNYKIMKFFTTVLCLCAVTIVNGQAFYFEPSPTDVTSPGKLFIDITSSECECPELQDADPATNPLYLWTWGPPRDDDTPRPNIGPNGSVNVANGEWEFSSENLKMQQDSDNPNVWYFDFLDFSLSEFYSKPAAALYEHGIFFLVKEKDGSENADGVQQKSVDLNLELEPVGCFEKVCPFPETFFQDQYFFITYDRNKETNSYLKDMMPDDGYIWYRISINGGTLTNVREATDKFKLDYDGDGIFSISMIPEDYFGLEEGDELTQLDVFITRAPIHIPPFTQPITLTPGCE